MKIIKIGLFLILFAMSLTLAQSNEYRFSCGLHEATSAEDAQWFMGEIYRFYESPAIGLLSDDVLTSHVVREEADMVLVAGDEWILYDRAFLKERSELGWIEEESFKTYQFRRSDPSMTGMVSGYWVLLDEEGNVVRDARKNWTEEDERLFKTFSRFLFVCSPEEIR